jgi:organic radical activating enzyme
MKYIVFNKLFYSFSAINKKQQQTAQDFVPLFKNHNDHFKGLPQQKNINYFKFPIYNKKFLIFIITSILLFILVNFLFYPKVLLLKTCQTLLSYSLFYYKLFCTVLIFCLFLSVIFYDLYYRSDQNIQPNYLEAGLNNEKFINYIRLISGSLATGASFITVKDYFEKKNKDQTIQQLNNTLEEQRKEFAKLKASTEELQEMNGKLVNILLNNTPKANNPGLQPECKELLSRLNNYTVKFSTSGTNPIEIAKDYTDILDYLKNKPELIEATKNFQNPENLITSIGNSIVPKSFTGDNSNQINSQLSISDNNNTTENAISSSQGKSTQLDKEDIIKSSILNNIFEDFDTLSGIKKLAVALLLLNSSLVSSLISITVVLYGDYLVEKYKLKERFPKFAKIIEFRQKLKKYSLYLDIIAILIVILTQVIFSLAILSL